MNEQFTPWHKNTRYKVGDQGTIIGVNGKKMVYQPSGDGYSAVKIGSISTLVHRMVAETYIPNPDNLPAVEHLNGNKWDNRVDNLAWTKMKTGRFRKSGWDLKLVNVNNGEIHLVHSAKAAADFIGCSSPNVLNLVNSGKIGPTKGFEIHKTQLDKSVFKTFNSLVLTEEQYQNFINN